MQAIADAAGRLLWVSPPLPLAHDLTVAHVHGIRRADRAPR